MRVLRPFAAIVFVAAAAWPQPLSGIDDIAIDSQGNILVAVTDLYQVLKIAPDGTVSVFAGTGRQKDDRGPGGDGGPAVAAELRRASSVTVDPLTNEVYIADDFRIRKVDSNGIITTVVGYGEQGDGVAGGEFAIEFALGWLRRIEFDPSSGKLYIAQQNGRIWRVENGRIYHHAGSGEDGCGGDGGPAAEAQFGHLIDLAVSSEGSVYLADWYFLRIHKVDPSGSTITAVVGNGRYWGYPIPDGTPALRTGIRQLHGLAFDFYNRLHFVGGDGLIYRLEQNGTLTLFSNGLDLEPGRMIFNPAGNLILLSDRSYRIYEVSADGRRVRTIVDLESDVVSALRSAGPAKSELSEYQRKIIGGREVVPGEWPFVVRVDASLRCTGSLVAPNWVLTAAHCLVDDEGIVDEPGDVSVFLGYDWDKGVCENTREEIGRVIVHPDYDHRSRGSIPDAALVEILQEAPADPIKLLTPEEEALYAPPGSIATVIGRGRQDDGSLPPVLRQVDLILWSTEDCRENSLWESWESGVINESALCAGRVESKKTAIGDSGGPFVVPLPAGGWGLVGINNLGSARSDSVLDYPSVLTRAAAIRDWVYEQIDERVQAKDDFEYWDLNGNSDLTCSEASGKDEGLKLPAYRDNRDGTGLIYEWLQRQRSSDTDNDGIACDNTSNPNGYVPRAGSTTPPPTNARECPAGSPTWMDLPVCEEGARVSYDRDAFGSAYSSLEDEIIDALPKSDGQVYTPYTCTLFDIQADGTAATDIEHIVALAEAYDSGLAESQFRTFAGDIDNLTIADPTVNRSQKSDLDAGEWEPPENRGWFAARIVAVKQKYGLSVNPDERDALQAMLNSAPSRTVSCGDGLTSGGPTYYFPHLAVGASWQTTITYINYSPEEVTCQTDFISDHGSPLMVSFAGLGTVVSRTDVLPPGGSVHQETNVDLSAPLAPGWARATCSGPVKASLLFRQFNEGVPVAEAGVNAAAVPATRFVTFAEQGEGQFGTGVAYANPSATAALVTFTARDADGEVLAIEDLMLPPNGHGAQNMPPLFDLSSFTGSLEVTSTEPIVSLSLNFEAAPVFSSLPPGELDASAQGSTTYYFPHLAVGASWQTTITYINYSREEVTCQTDFISDHGSPLMVSFAELGMVDRRTDVLPPGGSVHQETDVELSAPLAPGWALANCSGPVKASLLFRQFKEGVPTAEAGVNAATVPATRFVTFAEQGEGQFGTGVAYANPSATAALVTFTARDADGEVLAIEDLMLPPNWHDAQNMPPLFDLSSFTGSLEVTSTEPIVSLSLNFEAAPVFSSLPPGETIDIPGVMLAPADEAAFDDLFVGKRAATNFPAAYVDFVSPGRFRETRFAVTLTGSYTYRNTGSDAGTLTFNYDDGDRCTAHLTFTSATMGTATSMCDDGVSGAYNWRIVEIPSG